MKGPHLEGLQAPVAGAGALGEDDHRALVAQHLGARRREAAPGRLGVAALDEGEAKGPKAGGEEGDALELRLGQGRVVARADRGDDRHVEDAGMVQEHDLGVIAGEVLAPEHGEAHA